MYPVFVKSYISRYQGSRRYLEVVELAVAEVLALQHLLLAARPFLVDVRLVVELLGQMVYSLQPVAADD